MKISLLVVIPFVSAVEVEDSSSLLAVATQSSMAKNLVSAVGHRNVTHMEALVQELAQESLAEPGWKFDADIQAALEAIRNMFVKSIQGALNDAHREDQEHMSCFTESCFGNCKSEYDGATGGCDAIFAKCDGLAEHHVSCRHDVKGLYVHMAQSCGALHSFILGWEDEECTPEKCLCPDLLHCHRKQGYADECVASSTDCNSGYGSWLKRMITKYHSGYAQWSKLYGECKSSYHAFLSIDMQCDATQKEFERCLCQGNQCEADACNLQYDQCQAHCWVQYENLVKEKECLEKDRKIDWSATKKIECYIDVLLHDYTKEELLSKCGSETCINDAREEDYKHCATICPEVDFLGAWPAVLSVNPVQVAGHEKRTEADQYHLGDGDYKCDANGVVVFSKHRSSRGEETRCTEHLDIDYQIPECKPCRDPPPPICDADFHYKWYAQFDEESRITEISDCCPLQDGATCFPDVMLPSSKDGASMSYLSIKEHSHAWSFNRCPCEECITALPVYPSRPENHQCGMGAHTMSPGLEPETKLEWKNVCVASRGNGYATIKLEQDACVSDIHFTHVSGKVSCRKRASGDSNWGCDRESVALVLGDGGAVTAPVFGTTAGMTPHFSGHAHWYKMDGVTGDSSTMHWIFNQPVMLGGGAYAGEYRLWYNEDLTGGTEGDNRGEACYDVKMETTESCNALAPLQFGQVCASALGDGHATINLPADTCVTQIDLHHINGHVSCTSSEVHFSNFGCSTNLVGMVFTPRGAKNVVMPTTDVEGLTRTGHGHAHWYHMEGVGQRTRTLSMKLKAGVKPMKVSNGLDLWYNEDLTGGTEGDNDGRACYEVAVHRALHC
jgi:hypothetical protein